MAVKAWFSYISLPMCLPRDDTYAFHFAAITLHELAGHQSSLWWENEGEGKRDPVWKHKMMCLSTLVEDSLLVQRPKRAL